MAVPWTQQSTTPNFPATAPPRQGRAMGSDFMQAVHNLMANQQQQRRQKAFHSIVQDAFKKGGKLSPQAWATLAQIDPEATRDVLEVLRNIRTLDAQQQTAALQNLTTATDIAGRSLLAVSSIPTPQERAITLEAMIEEMESNKNPIIQMAGQTLQNDLETWGAAAQRTGKPLILDDARMQQLLSRYTIYQAVGMEALKDRYVTQPGEQRAAARQEKQATAAHNRALELKAAEAEYRSRAADVKHQRALDKQERANQEWYNRNVFDAGTQGAMWEGGENIGAAGETALAQYRQAKKTMSGDVPPATRLLQQNPESFEPGQYGRLFNTPAATSTTPALRSPRPPQPTPPITPQDIKAFRETLTKEHPPARKLYGRRRFPPAQLEEWEKRFFRQWRRQQ